MLRMKLSSVVVSLLGVSAVAQAPPVVVAHWLALARLKPHQRASQDLLVVLRPSSITITVALYILKVSRSINCYLIIS